MRLCGLTDQRWLSAMLASLAMGLLSATAFTAQAQVGPKKVKADLIAPTTAVRLGTPFVVGLRQIITPKWHTYWKNPGDSGEPTRLDWKLPEGWRASEIRWPIPEAQPVGPLMNHGYSDQLLLPVEITPPKSFDAETVTLTAHATWLVCEKICIPEEQTVSLTLDVRPPREGNTTQAERLPASQHATLFAQAERQLPVDGGWPASLAAGDDALILQVRTGPLDQKRLTHAHFFADTWGHVAPAAPQELTIGPDGLKLRLKPGELAGSSLKALSGVLVLTETLNGEPVRNGFLINAAVGDGASAGNGTVAGGASPDPSDPAGAGGDGQSMALGGGLGFWQAVLFAFLGGLILNLMPCVLPILSIKALSLASHGGRGPAFAFLGGVLISFGALAVLLLGLRAAGETVGWGFQFQSPLFVLGLAAFFFAMGLSLSGVFDIGGGVVGAGEGLARRSGNQGAFFTGVVATIAATPCTAPFMGVAIGYALTQPSYQIVLVLQALGVGFALPLMLLALSDRMRVWLPKPGAWMVTLKQVLAFPLYATVGWLVWVLTLQTGSDGVIAASIALVGVGVIAWLAGQAQWSSVARLAGGGALAALTVFLALPNLATSAAPSAPLAASDNAGAAPQSGGQAVGQVTSAGIPFETFSKARVAQLRAEGKAVFLNLTAAWCISCKVNEKVALSSDGFRAALKRYNVAYVKGDWTKRDDQITAVLTQHGRAGVPLYLLYPPGTAGAPEVLPQLLTEAVVRDHFASMARSAGIGD